MQLVAEQSNAPHSLLASQLDISWERASPEAKSQCVEKASGDCCLVCNMIASESRDQLYKAVTSQCGVEPSSDLEALIMGLRTQILSIYTFSYPIPVLMKLHEPYEKFWHLYLYSVLYLCSFHRTELNHHVVQSSYP